MAVQWIKNGWQQEKFCAVGRSMTSQPCPFDLGLRKFTLDFVVVIFFKGGFWSKITNSVTKMAFFAKGGI